jgi:hypothetical protein
MKKITVIALFALVFVCVAFAQETPTVLQKPGPEHMKLAGFIGNWTTEGGVVESPLGPAEKWSGTIRSEWFSDGFAVVRHVDEKSSIIADYHALDVITYDTAAKTYTWYNVDNQGWSGFIKGAFSGDVFTLAWEAQAKGKNYKLRGTAKWLGADTLTYVSEYSEDGTIWKPLSRSTDTRVMTK